MRNSIHWRRWLISLVLILIALGFFWISGSAIVIDETHEVKTAAIVDSTGNEQKLYRLWRGIFYTIPLMEGTFEIRCENGVQKRLGYVTGFLHINLKVVGSAPCERLIHDDYAL